MTEILELEQIRGRIDVPELIRAIEEGFVLYSAGDVVVPPVGFLNFEDPPGDVHIKYGYVKGDDVYVLKVASGFYENEKLGIPFADGAILVFSQKTGRLEVVLHDECWLTDIRTAAAGAVAARQLAPAEVRAIGIVGTGTQARLQLELLKDVVDCRDCFVWGRNPEKVDRLIDDLRCNEKIRNWGLSVHVAADMDELARRCNLIVTATCSREPLISAGQVSEGTHITAMGADDHGKQELEAALLGKADVVVADSISQCVDHGECCHAIKAGLLRESAIVELGDVISKRATGRSSDRQITIADLTGVAIQDIQVAKMALPNSVTG